MTLVYQSGSPSRTRTGTLFRARDFKYSHGALNQPGCAENQRISVRSVAHKAAFTQSFTQSGKVTGEGGADGGLSLDRSGSRRDGKTYLHSLESLAAGQDGHQTGRKLLAMNRQPTTEPAPSTSTVPTTTPPTTECTGALCHEPAEVYSGSDFGWVCSRCMRRIEDTCGT